MEQFMEYVENERRYQWALSMAVNILKCGDYAAEWSEILALHREILRDMTKFSNPATTAEYDA